MSDTPVKQLIPYAGKERPGYSDARGFVGRPIPLSAVLGLYSRQRALNLFESGHDTTQIAWLLSCTPAAAANALANARDVKFAAERLLRGRP